MASTAAASVASRDDTAQLAEPSPQLLLSEHYMPLVFVAFNNPEQFFACRYFLLEGYFSSAVVRTASQRIVHPDTGEEHVVNPRPDNPRPDNHRPDNARPDKPDHPKSDTPKPDLPPSAESKSKPAGAAADDKPAAVPTIGELFTSLMGGRVEMPYAERHKALDYMARDIAVGTPSYWNQIGYECWGMRLAVDVDAHDRVLTDAEIAQLGRMLVDTLRAYYASTWDTHPIPVVVSKCGPRLKKNRLSTGLHFIAHVQVSTLQARQLLHGFVFRIKRHAFSMRGLDIDASIYRGGGVNLRMIYSYKIEPCPVCRAHRDAVGSCTFCESRGRVRPKATYEPIAAFNAEGEVDDRLYERLHGDWPAMVRSHSIWSEPSDDRSGFSRPESDPEYVPPDAAEATPGGPRVLRDTKRTRLHDRSPAYMQLEEFIRHICSKGFTPWSAIEIDTIQVASSQKDALVTLVTGSPGSSFCLNAERDHGGNRVYFKLSRCQGTLTQFCHSVKKDYPCQSGPRASFTVPSHIICGVFGLPAAPPLVPVAVDSAKAQQWRSGSFSLESLTRPAPSRAPAHSAREAERLQEQRAKHILELQRLYHHVAPEPAPSPAPSSSSTRRSRWE